MAWCGSIVGMLLISACGAGGLHAPAPQVVTIPLPAEAAVPVASAIPSASPAASTPPPPEPSEAPDAGPPGPPECAAGLEIFAGIAGTIVFGGVGPSFFDEDRWELQANDTSDPRKKNEVSFSVHRGDEHGGPDMVQAFLLQRAGSELLGTVTTFVHQKPQGTEKTSFQRTCPVPPFGPSMPRKP